MGGLSVATIAAVALLLAGSSPVLACTPTTFQPELLQNPSFETGNLAPWVAHKLCTGCDDSVSGEVVKGDAEDGSWLFQETILDNIARVINQTITVDKPGQPHNVSFWYRYDGLEGSSGSCSVRVMVDGTTIFSRIGSSSAALNTGWNQGSFAWTPKGTAGDEHIFYVEYGCNNTITYLDNIQVLGPPEESVCSSTTRTPSSTPSRTLTPSGSSTPSTPSGSSTPSSRTLTPSGASTPSVSSTPSRTLTPSGSSTPSRTLTPSGSSTPSTPSGSSTPSASSTPSTPSGSSTPSSHTLTPSGSSAPSRTLTPSGSSTPSHTLIPPSSSTPSGSSTPSRTLTPSGSSSSFSTLSSSALTSSTSSSSTLTSSTSSSSTLSTSTSSASAFTSSTSSSSALTTSTSLSSTLSTSTSSSPATSCSASPRNASSHSTLSLMTTTTTPPKTTSYPAVRTVYETTVVTITSCPSPPPVLRTVY